MVKILPLANADIYELEVYVILYYMMLINNSISFNIGYGI